MAVAARGTHQRSNDERRPARLAYAAGWTVAALLTLAAVLWLVLIGRGEAPAQRALSLQPGADWQSVAIPDGSAEASMPLDWFVVPNELNGALEVRSPDTGAAQARLLVTHMPDNYLPAPVDLQGSEAVYAPEGAPAGSRYVVYNDVDLGLLTVSFSVPLEDGTYLSGQGVVPLEADARLAVDLVTVAESLAR